MTTPKPTKTAAWDFSIDEDKSLTAQMLLDLMDRIGPSPMGAFTAGRPFSYAGLFGGMNIGPIAIGPGHIFVAIAPPAVDWPREAIVHVAPEVVLDCLLGLKGVDGIPPDATVVRANYNATRNVFELVLAHPSFDPVAPGCTPYILDLYVANL